MLPSPKMLAIVAMVSFCSNWQFGYQITYINTASWSFYELADQIYGAQHDFSADGPSHLPDSDWNKQWSAILASFYAGTLIGFIMVPRLIRAVGGVRNALLYSSLPAILGCWIQLGVRFSNSTFLFGLVLSIGRLLVGVQAGCSLCLLPLFIIETSEFAHRPFLSSLQVVFQSLATLIGLMVGSDHIVSLGAHKLEWLQIIGLLPTMAFVFFLVCLPETPFRLLEKSQQMMEEYPKELDERLEQTFDHSVLFYYGPRADSCAIRAEASERWRVPTTGPKRVRRKAPIVENWKGLSVGIAAAVSFAFTADDLVDSFSAQFLRRSANSSQSSAELLTAALGLLLFITSIFGAFLADRFGRRRLLICGLLGTSMSNAGAAFGAMFGSVSAVTVGFALTKAFIGFGAGAPAWFLTSELVTPRFVAQGQAISTGCLLIATGLCTLSFLSLQDFIGSTGALLCLSSFPAFLVALFLFFMLPETKNLPFDQIRHLLLRHAMPGMVSHPRFRRALYFPLLDAESNKIAATICDDDATSATSSSSSSAEPWERSWELPHRSQRLMTASSYVSYGSIRSGLNTPATARPRNLLRRHSVESGEHRVRRPPTVPYLLPPSNYRTLARNPSHPPPAQHFADDDTFFDDTALS